ncbi:uncharacterized protein LOC128397909 [Panonychus citri]|uniref:uncharacterized protein LOC128397909 n=1 Tax=Panonychus citri TaxID=50023 RepID=UPI00230796E4|nr:uncharacterized protein LOC128397909 [Panonychus citri]
MFSSCFIFIILIVINYSRWTKESTVESDEIKNSFLWTIHLDSTKGLIRGPQRINETVLDVQLEICSCSSDGLNQENGSNERDSYCSVICDYKDKNRSFERRSSKKVRIAVVSFVVDENYFDDESLSVYEKTLRQSFDCIESGSCQDIESMEETDYDESLNHLLVKRKTDQDSHKNGDKLTKNRKGKKHKTHSAKHNNSKHAHSGAPTLRTIVPDPPIKPIDKNPFEDAQVQLRTFQSNPAVCFMFACPSQSTIHNDYNHSDEHEEEPIYEQKMATKTPTVVTESSHVTSTTIAATTPTTTTTKPELSSSTKPVEVSTVRVRNTPKGYPFANRSKPRNKTKSGKESEQTY